MAIVNPLAVTTIGSTYVNPAPLSTMSHDQPLPSMKMANGQLISKDVGAISAKGAPDSFRTEMSDSSAATAAQDSDRI